MYTVPYVNYISKWGKTSKITVTNWLLFSNFNCNRYIQCIIHIGKKQ